MLTTARLQTLVWTSRREEAARFYGDVLGLQCKGASHGALVYDVGGGDLRVSTVPTTAPSEHTVMGFAVADLPTEVAVLAERGVVFERFSSFQHDETGVWTAPDGAKIVWLRDPDGNLLSIVQYA